MSRILIVDDEEVVRDGLVNIIEYLNIEQITEIDAAADGEDALMKIKGHCPDIIITDLNMPRIDGLALIRQLTENSYAGKIIVISGYDDFHLVKQSFKLGITDYLLKPVHTEELRETLLNSIENLQKEQRSKSQAVVDQSRSWVENFSREFGFLVHKCECECDNRMEKEQSTKDLFQKMGLDLPHPYIMVAIVTVLEKKSESVSWQMKLAVDLMKEFTAADTLTIYPLFNNQNDLVLWFNFQQTPDLQRLAKEIRNQYSPSIFVIASSPVLPVHNHLWESYENAFHLVKYKLVSKAYSVIDNNITCNRIMSKFTSSDLKRLVNIVETGKKDEVQRFVDNFFNDDMLCRYTIEAISGMYDTVMRIIRWPSDKKRDIFSFDNSEQMRIYLTTCILQTIDENREVLAGYDIVEVAKQYVQEHIMGEINMAVVANYCNVSYHYFSKIFKAATDVNFQDYVTESKMAYARQALQGLNVKVNEVARMLGYNNPKNFTRAFKDYYGIGPKEYRNQVIRLRDGKSGL